ncbi:MAG: hypothetical protein WCS20_00230 [Alphaproteobacteria bacterium]
MSGPKAVRHVLAGNALTPTEWADLPQQIRNGRAVLLDKKTGILIFMVGPGRQGSQLTVGVRYFMKKRQLGERQTNGIVSAFEVPLTDIEGRVKGGEPEIVWGNLK